MKHQVATNGHLKQRNLTRRHALFTAQQNSFEASSLANCSWYVDFENNVAATVFDNNTKSQQRRFMNMYCVPMPIVAMHEFKPMT